MIQPRQLLTRAQDSLLLLPVAMVLGFVALAIGFSQISDEPGWIIDVDVTTARSVLSVIGSSTLTVAGIVISFLALTIQLAASNYSPRLVPRFLNDKFQQAVIGLIVGTFAFSVTSLADLGNTFDDGSSPALAANMAIVLALLSTIGIISFIDRIARHLRIDDTIQRISIATEKSFASRSESAEPGGMEGSGSFDESGEGIVIPSDRLGWLLKIDTERLIGAVPHDALARISVEIGDYVGIGSPLVTVWSREEIDRPAVQKCFSTGSSRSIEADPLFGLRQLVDIALRSLSPGINDPTTAADVMRQLVRPLSEAAIKPQPPRVIHGEHGQRIYVPRRLTPENIIGAGLNEIIDYSGSQPYVLEATLEAIDILRFRIEDADPQAWKGVLDDSLDRVVRRIATSTLDVDDRKSLLKEAERVHKALQS